MKISWALFCGAVGTLAFPAVTNAQLATCAQAYEKAQEEKSDGHLSAAIAAMRACVGSDCPEFIREDCKRWLNQTEAELPTVVFSVTRDGKDESESEFFCDGKLLTGVLDGKAVPIDPGFHVLAVRVPGSSAIERKVLIREGERNRILEFEFHSSTAAASAGAVVAEAVAPPKPALDEALPVAPVLKTNPNHAYWTYGLSGVGVLGLAGFSLFAALGRSEKADLEQSCAPYCRASQIDSVRAKYLIADTCLGVGIVSLGVATYLYISNRRKSGDTHDNGTEAFLEIVPRPAGAGGVVRLSRPF